MSQLKKENDQLDKQRLTPEYYNRQMVEIVLPRNDNCCNDGKLISRSTRSSVLNVKPNAKIPQKNAFNKSTRHQGANRDIYCQGETSQKASISVIAMETNGNVCGNRNSQNEDNEQDCFITSKVTPSLARTRRQQRQAAAMVSVGNELVSDPHNNVLLSPGDELKISRDSDTSNGRDLQTAQTLKGCINVDADMPSTKNELIDCKQELVSCHVDISQCIVDLSTLGSNEPKIEYSDVQNNVQQHFGQLVIPFGHASTPEVNESENMENIAISEKSGSSSKGKQCENSLNIPISASSKNTTSVSQERLPVIELNNVLTSGLSLNVKDMGKIGRRFCLPNESRKRKNLCSDDNEERSTRFTPVKAEVIKDDINDSPIATMKIGDLSCEDVTKQPPSKKLSKLLDSVKREAKTKVKSKSMCAGVHIDLTTVTKTRSMANLSRSNSTSLTELLSKRPRKPESSVWLNRRIEQQACMLWSSEEKRRFQQQHPNMSNEWIEDKMRTHWEALGDRDRNRYIQRARQATQLGHHQSVQSRRGLTQHQLSEDDFLSDEAILSHRLQHCTSIQLKHLFNSGSIQQQYSIIQHKLWSLQRRLFATDYRLLGRYLYSRLLLAMAADDAESLQWSHMDTVGSESWQKKVEERGRQVIYSVIEELEASVDGVVNGRFMALRKQAFLHYQTVLTYAVDGSHPSTLLYDDQCTSAQLGQVLDDLHIRMEEDSASDYRLTAADRDAVRVLEDELSRGWFGGSLKMSLGDGQLAAVPDAPSAPYTKLLLHEASSKQTIVQLGLDDIEECFREVIRDGCDAPTPSKSSSFADWRLVEAAGHVYRMLHGVELCCGLDSPSCVLSCLLSVDKMSSQPSTAKDNPSSTYNVGADIVKTAVGNAQQPFPVMSLNSWSDEELLCGDRVTIDANAFAVPQGTTSGRYDEDGILGIDSWLTSAIEPWSASGTVINSEVADHGDDVTEQWILQPDDLNYINMMNESNDIGLIL